MADTSKAAGNLGKQAAGNAAGNAGKIKEKPFVIDTKSQPPSRTTNMEQGVNDAIHMPKK